MEIKDPSFNRGDSVPQMSGKKSYLHKNAEGKVQLMSNHSFYYQIQTQLLVTGFKFCDFFVWTEKDTFLETIRVDTSIQADILSNIIALFCNVLLRELVSKYFTNSTNSGKSQDKWCICKMSKYEKVKLVKFNSSRWNAWGIKKFLKANVFVSNVKKKKKDNWGNKK